MNYMVIYVYIFPYNYFLIITFYIFIRYSHWFFDTFFTFFIK